MAPELRGAAATAAHYKAKGKPVAGDSLVDFKVRWRDEHFEYTARVKWHGDNGYVLEYTDVRLLPGPEFWVGGKTPTATSWTVLDD